MSVDERLEARVEGIVQGVGFRWFVVRHAERLGLGGWVANEADGGVRVVAEGPPGQLDQLEALLREGPSGARVSAVQAQRRPAGGHLDGFHVRASGHRGD